MPVGAGDLTQIQGELGRRRLIRFFTDAWPLMDPAPLSLTWHLEALCEHLQLVSTGEIKRLIVSMPPRMTKSLSCSVAWPVWEWIESPQTQFLTSSYDLNLSTRDALKSRRLIESPWFQDRWGKHITLRHDENMKSRYSNTEGGHRIAISSGGRTTGEGGDIILLDDSHNAREAYSDAKREGIVEWYDNAMRSRLNNQNTGRIVHVGQRVHEMDVIGHVIKKEGRCNIREHGKWVHLVMPNEFRPGHKCVINLPKEIEKHKKNSDYEPEVYFEDPRSEENDLLCPDRLGKEATKALKPPTGMSERDYNSQYQQDPAADDGLILKRSWWRPWQWPEWHPDHTERRPMPHCVAILQSYDTAFETREENDYSARTTWGIFEHSEERLHAVTGVLLKSESRRCAILLEAWHDKVAFPDLRRLAKEAADEFDPDWILVEKKASGHSLLQELRRTIGASVKGVDPGGKDKVMRAHISSNPLEMGCVYYVPGHSDGQSVIDECSKFPMGEYDDYVDTVVMLLAFLRRIGSLDLYDEDEGDMNLFKPKRKQGIYG